MDLDLIPLHKCYPKNLDAMREMANLDIKYDSLETDFQKEINREERRKLVKLIQARCIVRGIDPDKL